MSYEEEDTCHMTRLSFRMSYTSPQPHCLIFVVNCALLECFACAKHHFHTLEWIIAVT